MTLRERCDQIVAELDHTSVERETLIEELNEINDDPEHYCACHELMFNSWVDGGLTR